MFFLIYIYIFLVGTCVGSFLNVVVDRLPKRQSIVGSRSICPHCKKKLQFRDLVPLFSFIYLRGRCRYCKKRIDKTLPLVEFLTGAVFVLVLARGGGTNIVWLVESAYYLAIFSILIAVFFMDLKYRVIEDKLVLAGVFIWVLYTLISSSLYMYASYVGLKSDPFGKYLIKAGFLNRLAYNGLKGVVVSLMCGVSLFLFFYFLARVTKGRGMGGGDIKLAFLMGLVLGFPKVFPAFFAAFLTGAFIGLILILAKRKTIKQTIPFGPFLVLGTVFGLLFGEEVVSWYLKLL